MHLLGGGSKLPPPLVIQKGDRMKNAKIHVVPTFHHDIAYLKPERDYTEKAIAIVDKALSLMEEDPAYTFTVEQAYFLEQYLLARPENREKMRVFVKKGQLLLAPGFWSVPDMCMPSGESIYMQAKMG